MRLALICLLVVVSVTAAFASQYFPVLDDRSQATIVYPAQLDEPDDACTDLATYLNQATGQEFRIISDARFRRRLRSFPIYVGRCAITTKLFGQELATLDADAFMVVVEPQRVFLFGPTEHATYWAVCDFLERYVGVRWLIPGPLGEDVPQHDRIVVPPTRRTEMPRVLSRWWSGTHYAGDWSKRMRMRDRYQFDHNLSRVFDPDKHFDEHPEYFAEYGGKRSPSRPCLTELGTIDVAAQTAREAWANDPSLESFSFGPRDGQSFCDCEDCRRLKKYIKFHGWPHNNNSYLFFGWLNKVASKLEQTHPDKLVGTLAYYSYVVPPPEMRFQLNILPYMCVTIANSVFPRCRTANYDLYARWGDKVNQTGIYDYGYGMGYAIPRIYTHVFQDTIQYAVKHDLKGFHAEVYPNWGLDGPRLYMMARILWNPDVDLDALLDEWNARMFRGAAEPMKKYFARCEQAWNEQPHPGGSDFRIWRLVTNPDQFRIFTPEIMAECTAYLDEAAAMASTDIVKERIQFFRKTWEITLLLSSEWWKGERVRELVAEDAPVREVAAALRIATERPSSEEYEEQVKEMVGGDHIAFFPAWTNKGWLVVPQPLETDGIRHWAAAKLAAKAIEKVRRRGFASDRTVPWAIHGTGKRTFHPSGPEAYNATAAEITAMVSNIAAARIAERKPRMDGHLDEKMWQYAQAVSGFTLDGNKAAANPTSVKLAHDGQDLYVGFECTQDLSQLSGIQVKRDGPVEADDSVTLLLRPTSADKPYIQVAINVPGGFLDAMFLPADQQFGLPIEYDYDFAWATGKHKNQWTAELKVPLQQLGWQLSDESIFRMNVVRRVRSSGDETSTWFPNFTEEGPEAPVNQGWLIFAPE